MATAIDEQAPRFNVGVYSLKEAARLVRMKSDRVKRLVKGYEFRGRRGQRSSSPPLFRGQFEEIDGTINLSFPDLIELLFVRDFREHGVSMPVIRRAAEVAAEMYGGVDHPFCFRKFSTDGKRIFTTAADAEGDEHMVDLVRRQHVFAQVMDPFLKQLEYSEAGQLLRWFPLGKDKRVVLDPRLSFGAPIVAKFGVPTSVLYAAHRAGESEENIAAWYDVPVAAIQDAISFECSLEQRTA
ncbi:DUF433 domain-containing protein [Myxococcus faecalis]|uniref:DUF433 domain-containing protein n=1 Tax=Myxococcus faecalis TaxID=3115646 RepID=UPI003CECAD42